MQGTSSSVCVECGIEFEPFPWADPDDLICDDCIEQGLEGPYDDFGL